MADIGDSEIPDTPYDAIIATCLEALGGPLWTYIVNTNYAGVTAPHLDVPKLTPGQVSVLETLRAILDMRLPYETKQDNRRDLIRALMLETDEKGGTIAGQLHGQAGGASPTLPSSDVGAIVGQVANDVYPALLIPENDDPFFPTIGNSIYATAAIFRHPLQVRFQDALFKDQTLASKFTDGDPAVGRTSMVWRNTGSGGTVQASMLLDQIIGGAWRHIKDDSPTPERLIEASAAQLALICHLLKGQRRITQARFAFMGIQLPSGTGEIAFSDAVLRTTTAADRALAPGSLKGQLTGTNRGGETTVVNYDGDVVLCIDFDMAVRARAEQPGPGAAAWPQDMKVPESLEHQLERLRISLVLAVERPDRVQLLPTWRFFDDPFGYGSATGWSDPRRTIGIMPATLTNEEVKTWVEWYRRLSNPHVKQIQLAVSRVLRAIEERREPADVLVDAVIAWENMFGTAEGEPTLRVTASLALLLGATLEERKRLRSRYKDIYKLRSRVVHGSGAIRGSEHPMCQEALDVALQALRKLTYERTDILRLPDGNERSLHLILDADATREA